MNYWVISPFHADEPAVFEHAWAYDLAHNVIAIGWHDIGDPATMSLRDIGDAIEKVYRKPEPGAAAMIWTFYHEIQEGDVIIARRGVKQVIGIGTVRRTAYHDPMKGQERLGGWNPRFKPHFIDVDWEVREAMDFDHTVFTRHTVAPMRPQRYAELFGQRAA